MVADSARSTPNGEFAKRPQLGDSRLDPISLRGQKS
jgi:hypothetical protein